MSSHDNFWYSESVLLLWGAVECVQVSSALWKAKMQFLKKSKSLTAFSLPLLKFQTLTFGCANNARLKQLWNNDTLTGFGQHELDDSCFKPLCVVDFLWAIYLVWGHSLYLFYLCNSHCLLIFFVSCQMYQHILDI